MKWAIGLLALSNVALWFALNKCLDAIREWMDAMKDTYDEHQHVRDYGLDSVQLSGKPLSTVHKEPTE
jgi:hypothetical protein